MNSETWYEKLGFFDNPFSIKINANNLTIYGYDDIIKKTNEHVTNGDILLITGDYGNGKSLVLKNIIKQFKGKNKIILVSCNRYNNDLNVEKLIIKAGGIISRIFKKMKRNIIILLDEAQELSHDELTEIFDCYIDNYFKSIVCVASHIDHVEFPKKMRDKIGNNIIQLDGLKYDDAVNIVKERLGNVKLLPETIIKKIYNISGKNPRIFLINCEEVCRKAVDEGRDKVADKDLDVLK